VSGGCEPFFWAGGRLKRLSRHTGGRATAKVLPRMLMILAQNYGRPDQCEFCFTKLMAYHHQCDAFSASGGSDRCDSEI